MPPQRQFADGDEWAIGKPDLVVRFPAHRCRRLVPICFPNVTAPTGLTEDRYIKAIETRPVDANSRRVVHHAITTMLSGNADGAPAGPDADGANAQFIVEYASGKAPEVYPENSGVLLKAGSTLSLDNHLHSVGEDINSQVEVGFLLYPKGVVPKYIRYSTHHGDPTPTATDSLDIPAGTVARVDGYTLHTKPGKIIAWQPHMHIRGKYQCLELIYPGNPSNIMKRETINCANWDYNWHSVYNYQDQAAPLVPAGTVIHIISWHDNSAANRNNPDPQNWVGYGDRTIDEMGFSWIGWIDLTPEEYEKELAERTAARQKARRRHNSNSSRTSSRQDVTLSTRRPHRPPRARGDSCGGESRRLRERGLMSIRIRRFIPPVVLAIAIFGTIRSGRCATKRWAAQRQHQIQLRASRSADLRRVDEESRWRL